MKNSVKRKHFFVFYYLLLCSNKHGTKKPTPCMVQLSNRFFYQYWCCLLSQSHLILPKLLPNNDHFSRFQDPEFGIVSMNSSNLPVLDYWLSRHWKVLISSRLKLLEMKLHHFNALWMYSGTPPYDHPFIATTFLRSEHWKAHTFSYLKTSLIRPHCYYDQSGPPFGVLGPYFL